jgi:HEAT repeat protein
MPTAHAVQATRRRALAFLTRLLCVLCVLGGERIAAQEPNAPETIAPAALQAAINNLGALDYNVRTTASRTIRRAAGAQAVPALLQAASEHADGYVRYRALVLLTGFNDPRTVDLMRQALASPNDRLRAAGYGFFEHHPDARMVPDFIAALDTEQGEFVRPALVRALVATGDPRARQPVVRDVARGEDFFRSTVIEALGDYKAAYAFDALTSVAKVEGPLQGDAALALGKIGDKRALETLAALQRSAPRQVQPTIAAAICLLGVNCGSHENYLVDTLKFADRNIGFQELLRAAAAGLGALAVSGNHNEAVDALFDVGLPSRDPTRSPVTLALATVALRNTPLMLSVLAAHSDREHAVELVAEGFDMLEEDLDKERFFATVRRAYWDAPENSPTRDLMRTLIGKLDF